MITFGGKESIGERELYLSTIEGVRKMLGEQAESLIRKTQEEYAMPLCDLPDDILEGLSDELCKLTRIEDKQEGIE
jgi:hypothetical protein